MISKRQSRLARLTVPIVCGQQNHAYWPNAFLSISGESTAPHHNRLQGRGMAPYGQQGVLTLFSVL